MTDRVPGHPGRGFPTGMGRRGCRPRRGQNNLGTPLPRCPRYRTAYPGHPGRGAPTEMGRRGRRPLQYEFHTQNGHHGCRGEPCSPAEKLCFSAFPKGNNRTIRLAATKGRPYDPNSMRRADHSDRSGGFCSPYGKHNLPVTNLSRSAARPHVFYSTADSHHLRQFVSRHCRGFIDCLRENPNCALPGLEIYDMMHTTLRNEKQEVSRFYGPQTQRSEPEASRPGPRRR